MLLTAPLGKLDSYRVAVDAKTTASGSLNDNQVDWATLREHRDKHDANFSLLVAPNPSGNRLMNRAQEFSVAVLSADQLAELCRRHARAPLSLVDYKKLFAMTGEVDLGVIDEATEHLMSLQRLVSLLSGGLSEKTDGFGRMSARDVQLAFGEEAKGVSQDEIQRLLDMLAHPLIGVVYGFGDNAQRRTRPRTTFWQPVEIPVHKKLDCSLTVWLTLNASLDLCCVKRICAAPSIPCSPFYGPTSAAP